jgi:RNA polymerase sigma factor (sigma-70 family)
MMATMEPAGSEVSDEDIVGQSFDNPGAFGAIFDRHFSTIYGYLARRVGSHVADDLASQVFLVAFDRRRSFRAHEGGARPWLYRIATNILSNHRRSEQRLLDGIARMGQEAGYGRFSETGVAEDQAMVNIELQQIAALLASLDPSQRDALFLYVWAGLAYDEIAISLDIPLGTVRSRLSRARQAIRAQLADVTQPQITRIPIDTQEIP